MKKILGKIKKVLYIFAIILLTGKQRVLGTVTLYGNVRINPENNTSKNVRESVDFLKYAKIMILPLIFIIGSFVYFKKSKSSRRNKIIYITTALFIIILIYIIIYFFKR